MNHDREASLTDERPLVEPHSPSVFVSISSAPAPPVGAWHRRELPSVSSRPLSELSSLVPSDSSSSSASASTPAPCCTTSAFSSALLRPSPSNNPAQSPSVNGASASPSILSASPFTRPRVLEAHVLDRFRQLPRGSLEKIIEVDDPAAGLAMQQLLQTWKDERTRQVLEEAANPPWQKSAPTALEEMALQCFRRSAPTALEYLAATWPDERTQGLLRSVVIRGVFFSTTQLSREAALLGLVRHFHGEQTRELLIFVIWNCKPHEHSQELAIAQLVQHFKDDRTRRCLELAVKVNENSAEAAAESLCCEWRDERTRQLVERFVRAEQGDSVILVGRIDRLIRHWPDDRTRRLVEWRAKQRGWMAMFVVEKLTMVWGERDDRMRRVLEEVVKVASAGAPVAMTRLADWWQDESMRKVLEEWADTVGCHRPDGLSWSQLFVDATRQQQKQLIMIIASSRESVVGAVVRTVVNWLA